MNATTFRILCLACAALLLGGCSTFREGWKDTRKLYKEYVNTDTKVNINNTAAPGGKADLKLAKLFMPADENLEKLLRLFSAQDVMPPPDWCRELLDVYPWLAGVAIVQDDGAVTYKYPSVDVIPTNFESLLKETGRYKTRKMAGAVDVTELGAVVYIATPLFRENDYHGILVAYFDPRSLVKFSPNPGELYVVASEGVLWGGNDQATASALAAEKWTSILKGNVSGTVSAAGGKYLWQARYIGNKPIIYLANEKTPFVAAAPEAADAWAAPASPPEEPFMAAPPAAPQPQPAKAPKKAAAPKPAKKAHAKAKVQERTIAPDADAKPAPQPPDSAVKPESLAPAQPVAPASATPAQPEAQPAPGGQS